MSLDSKQRDEEEKKNERLMNHRDLIILIMPKWVYVLCRKTFTMEMNIEQKTF